MMISELNDEEILDFLMTSDFEEEYSPKELKYFLLKWRFFYRVIYGKLENTKVSNEFEIKELKEQLESIKNSLIREQFINTQKEDTINSMKTRKLTFKERLTGKIILKNEDK